MPPRPTLAVLLVVSLITTAITVARIVIERRELTPSRSLSPVPMVSASPVEPSRPPSAMPEPNSTIVPQSIRAASFQVIVNCRRGQSMGRRKSSVAPRMATAPSCRWVETLS